MKFDRNTIVGFLLLAALFIGYFLYTSKEQAEAQKKRNIEQAKLDSVNRVKRFQDSIARVNNPKSDTSQLKKDTSGPTGDSNQVQFGSGTESLVTINNGVMKIGFTSKGGQPKKVELLNYKGQDSLPVKLASTDFDKIDYTVNSPVGGGSASIKDLNFSAAKVDTAANGDISIAFDLGGKVDSNHVDTYIRHVYVIHPKDYMIDFSIQLNNADKLLTQGNLNLVWNYRAMQQESNLSFEKQNTQIGYVMDGDFDYHTIVRRADKEFSHPVKWLGVRQRFFNTFFVAKNNFNSGRIEWTVPSDTSTIVVQSTANLQVKLPVQRTSTADFQIFYGPADYHIITKYDLGFGKIINLGQGIYAFVRPLNKYLVIPIFDFVKSLAGSIGIAIALLTIFIRLITSPLMYPGYKTSAQMKVLRPDLAKLKEKYPEQQQYAMEQMKFMRQAGVNQFAGCLPALVQIPIFFSLYSFFNSSIDLRGQSFLWANDLAASDAVIHFGFNIPLLGSHLSLFTLTAVFTSFLISLYGMSMSPDQSNPVMKYMPYIFPFFLLFIFNSLPSALTWYYTVSNLITLGLQFFIQNYIINHDKILAKIEENRRKPKTKSKWQERMEQIQEQQKRMRETQQKNKR